MGHLTTADKIQLYKNLLDDPDDWISAKILELDAQSEAENDCGGDKDIASDRNNKGAETSLD